MKLENQVVSLELSKQLKEAGYKQEGVWCWVLFGQGYVKGHSSYNPIWEMRLFKDSYNFKDSRVVAPTVAELGLQLPDSIKQRTIGSPENQPIEYQHGGTYYLYTQKDCCFYAMNNGQTRLYRKDADTEANARAKMWLYLKKENLL